MKIKPGAYGVRCLFVIYGFPLAETANIRTSFLLGRALEPEGSEPFNIAPKTQRVVYQICSFLQVTDPSFDTLLTFARGRLP